MKWDAVVIGAGAAGLMAARHASELGARVCLLEKSRKAGVKILMSGGTRCNITHHCDNRGIVSAYGQAGKFLHSALAYFSTAKTVQFFNDEGVATKVEETGKVFPVSDRAIDVRDALVRALHRSGAELRLGEPATDVRVVGDEYEVVTPRETHSCRKLLICSGGKSYPGCGTTGDGYAFAAQFGHTIVPPVPSLVPIVTDAEWVKELRGITLDDVELKVLDGDQVLATRRRGLLFAHFGLTGPAPLDVSRAVARHPRPRTLRLLIDFLPGTPDAEFDAMLQRESLQQGKKLLAGVLGESVPRRLADAALGAAGQPVDRRAAGLTRDVRQLLTAFIKRNSLSITGTLGFEKAEVTAGGVSLDEVDSRTMQSKLRPGLYLAGEVLDLDGPIGGYNFQAAWSTGMSAGRSLAGH